MYKKCLFIKLFNIFGNWKEVKRNWRGIGNNKISKENEISKMILNYRVRLFLLFLELN